MKNRLNTLQQNNVFIHTMIEHYGDGSNVSFSIEFKKFNEQTGWYNDNHEFGDAGSVMASAIELAEWYLADHDRIEAIRSVFNHPLNILRGEKIKHIINNIQCSA